LGVGLTTLPCKKENCREASKKFSQILWRRPRPKLGCGAKERRRRRRRSYKGILRHKNREHPKSKINELETNNKSIKYQKYLQRHK
jgi:hypothetical protein